MLNPKQLRCCSLQWLPGLPTQQGGIRCCSGSKRKSQGEIAGIAGTEPSMKRWTGSITVESICGVAFEVSRDPSIIELYAHYICIAKICFHPDHLQGDSEAMNVLGILPRMRLRHNASCAISFQSHFSSSLLMRARLRQRQLDGGPPKWASCLCGDGCARCMCTWVLPPAAPGNVCQQDCVCHLQPVCPPPPAVNGRLVAAAHVSLCAMHGPAPCSHADSPCAHLSIKLSEAPRLTS